MPTSFELNDVVTDKLDWLQDATESSSKADVLIKAVALLEHVVDRLQSGGKIVLQDADGSSSNLTL